MVFDFFFRGQFHCDPVCNVGRKYRTFQFINMDPVDDFTKNTAHDGIRFVTVIPFRRGCQTEPVGGKTHGGTHPVDLSGQVMTFIENDQAELIADVFHLQNCGVVRADGDLPDLFTAAAQHPDRDLKHPFQLGCPLL
jgi:hypothetical protein